MTSEEEQFVRVMEEIGDCLDAIAGALRASGVKEADLMADMIQALMAQAASAALHHGVPMPVFCAMAATSYRGAIHARDCRSAH